MKQMSKTIFVFMLILSILLLTVACGGQTDSTKAETATSPATTGVTTIANPLGKIENPITIHIGKTDTFAFYGQNKDYTSAENNVWIDSMKNVLNVDFVFDWINTDSKSDMVKWNTAMASGNLPDMGVVKRTTYESLLEAGLVADMTDAYEMYASEQVRSLVNPSFELPYMTRNGRLYGLPQTNSYPQNFDTLVIRKDWLDQVGMKAPKTIDDLVNVATAFKNAKLGGDNTYGLAASPQKSGNRVAWGSLIGFFQGYGIPYGVWAKDKDGNAYYGSTDVRMKDAILRLQSMYKDGLLRKDYLVANTTQSVAAGEAGMLYSICYGPVFAADLYMADPKVDMIAVEIPTLDGSLPTYYDSVVPNAFVFVNSKFKNLEAAVKVVNLTVENLSDMNYDWGYIRGACPIGSVMYEKPFSFCEYAREIEYAYKTNDLTKFTTANAKIYYERSKGFEAGDRALGKYYPIYRPENGTYAILNDAYESNRIQNTLFSASETETMVEKSTILKELLETAMHKVIMGDNISVWEQAVAEWTATGGKTMTDEVNKWYKAQK